MRYDREDSEEEVIPNFYYLHEKQNAEPDVKKNLIYMIYVSFLRNKKNYNKLDIEREDRSINQRTWKRIFNIFSKNHFA